MDSTTTKIVVALITFIIIGWATAITRSVSTVTGLEPQIVQLQKTQDQQGQWISDWPSQGELSADVRQNKDIEFLFREMEESTAEIEAIKLRLREVEIRSNGND
jgi:hypothetical protein